MAHQVKWTKSVLEFFIEQALLNPFEEKIIRTRVIEGLTVTEQARLLMCSKSKVEKSIALLKQKYDMVQQEFPDKLPQRKFSAKEVYMDTH